MPATRGTATELRQFGHMAALHHLALAELSDSSLGD